MYCTYVEEQAPSLTDVIFTANFQEALVFMGAE